MANAIRAALLRRRSIAGLDQTGSSGLSYSGAQYSRITQDWIYAPIQSADQEARWDMYRLRARARELRRNNPYVARIAEMIAENVVGHDGMWLQPLVANGEGRLDISINDTIAEAWDDWTAPEQCSVDGRFSFVDHEQLAVQNAAIDGEALIRLVRGYPNDFGFAIQALDIDLLDHTLNRPADARRNEIRMGVEINAWGKPVQYWMWNRHPYDINGSFGREHDPQPAEDIIHLHRPARPGQTRSVTWLAPVMLPLKLLHGFIEAELVAARTAAAAMGFYVTDAEYEDDPDSPAAEGQLVFEAEPGTMALLPPGVTDVKTFAPNHPNINTESFVKTIVRWIAGGVSMSYNALGNDLESVNYSSIRAGELSARDHWRTLQRWDYTHFHRRIYLEFLKYATASGAVSLPGRNVTRWHRHRWMPRGWAWVDPLKEITAAAARLQLSMGSRRKLLSEEGVDLEEVFRDIRDEKDLATKYGIDLVNVIGNARVTEDANAPKDATDVPASKADAEGTDSGDASGDRAANDAASRFLELLNDGGTDDDVADREAAKTLRLLLAGAQRRANGNGRPNGHTPKATNG